MTNLTLEHLHDEIQQLHKRLAIIEEWKHEYEGTLLSKLSEEILIIKSEIKRIQNARDERP